MTRSKSASDDSKKRKKFRKNCIEKKMWGIFSFVYLEFSETDADLSLNEIGVKIIYFVEKSLSPRNLKSKFWKPKIQ